MNWNVKAEDYAVAHHTYEHLSFAENNRHATGFVRGAKWQLGQLCTDEAVERLALHLIKDEGIDVSNGWPTNEYFGGGPAGDRDVEFKRAWMKSTRAAITALLGEES